MPASGSEPTVGVIIDNYNGEAYVTEAIESVFGQNRPPDELIIVDDGSTDESHKRIQATIAGEPIARLIEKENGGQLSALQRGIAESTADILFFLDNDDLWEPLHITRFLEVYTRHPDVDFVYSGYREFGNGDHISRPYERSLHLGYSALRTAFNGDYVGSITSALSARRRLLERFLPLPDEIVSAWRVCADEAIVRGASIFRGVKYYVDTPTVRYRIHRANRYHSKTDLTARFDQKLRASTLTTQLVERAGLRESAIRHLRREFQTVPQPTLKCYRDYVRAARNLRVRFIPYLQLRSRLWRHYRKTRGGPISGEN